MITEARIDNLLRCVRNNEAAHDFCFYPAIHPCGTFGCMFGNDMLAVYDGYSQSEGAAWAKIRNVAKADTSDLLVREYGLLPLGSGLVMHWLFYCCNGRGDTREQRIHRLRKFIYYVQRKRAILYDEQGRIKESARRTEGNWMVCPKVMETLAVGV